MTAIRAAAVLLALCSVSVPGMAQNRSSVTPTLLPDLPAVPPANAIAGTLDRATGQFTPLAADTTKPTIINKTYTFTPDFSKIGPEAAILHTISCSLIVLPYFQSGYAEATNQFDPESPPATLTVHVFYTAYIANPTIAIRRLCTGLDENNETHVFNNTTADLPVDKLATNYKDAVIF